MTHFDKQRAFHTTNFMRDVGRMIATAKVDIGSR